jgi:2-methylcitrate dehydratase PrpD
LYPAKFPSRVTVTLKDGRTFAEMRDFPKGDPQDPLTPEEIEAKFVENASGVFGESRVREIVARVRDLGEEGTAAPLTALLAG